MKEGRKGFLKTVKIYILEIWARSLLELKRAFLYFLAEILLQNFVSTYPILFTSYLLFPAHAEFSDEVSNKTSNDSPKKCVKLKQTYEWWTKRLLSFCSFLMQENHWRKQRETGHIVFGLQWCWISLQLRLRTPLLTGPIASVMLIHNTTV